MQDRSQQQRVPGATGRQPIRWALAQKQRLSLRLHPSNELGVRTAGAFGLGSVLFLIPPYVAGIPSDLADATALASNHDFLAGNTTSLLCHLAAGMVFLAGITSAIWSAAGPSVAVLATFTGGTSFLTLMTIGYAAQIALASAVHNDPELTSHFVLIACSAIDWLYRFAMIGAGLLVLGVSFSVRITGILPRGWAWGGALSLLPMFFTWVPAAASIGMIAWICMTSLLLICALNKRALTRQ